MASSTPDAQSEELARAVKAEAQRIGFDLVGIAPAVSPTTIEYFRDWFAAGYAGEMHYVGRREAAYEHPQKVLAPVRSLIIVAQNYFSPDSAAESEPHAKVARYARGTGDYHHVLKQRLQQLADFLHQQRPGCRTRPAVDTAPLLERDYARLAGLGWFGKNTMLINKKIGSWLFLGALLTDLELPADQPHQTDHCGTCTRCLDACPTDAFAAPYVLDARRCISYLTIELRDDPIPVELRPQMNEWIFGCDVCQDVCPWNRKAPQSTVPEFAPRADLALVDLEELLRLNESSYQEQFGPTPLERPRRAGLLRNAAIAAGNSKDERYVPELTRLLEDSEPLIRDAAAWALTQISSGPDQTSRSS